MTDIIQDAKRLLDGATPGPWRVDYVDPDYPELQGAPQVENGIVRVPILLSDIYADFSPEDGDLVAEAWTHAKALAEETWEYGVEYTGINHGNRHTEWCPREHYLTSKEKAELEYKKMEKMHMNPRMVRRRVSPVEVVE